MATETKKKTAKAKVETTEEVAEVKKTRKPRAKKVTPENTEVTEDKEVKETKKAKKAEPVKEEVKKPLVTEAKAKALTLKVTPRKCRLVVDLVRGKSCSEALEILFNTHKEAAPMVAKVIKSAVANAVNNFNMREDKLYVASIMASDSVKMKRYLPRAKGSASGMVKRFTNLYVVVKEKN